jgi:hypothetical protein
MFILLMIVLMYEKYFFKYMVDKIIIFLIILMDEKYILKVWWRK